MATRTLNPLIAPDVRIRQYYAQLVALLDEIREEAEPEIIALYERERPVVAQDATNQDVRSLIERILRGRRKSLDTLANNLAREVARKTSQSNKEDLLAELRRVGFAVRFRTTARERALLQRAINQNVQLIKSIPSRYLDDVAGKVEKAIDNGKDISGLKKDLVNCYGISERKALTIARTEVNKAYEALSMQRMQDIGITEGIWIHRSASRYPRHTHRYVLNGKRFKLAEGLYDPDPYVRRNVWPGSEPNCRCTYKAVLRTDQVTRDHFVADFVQRMVQGKVYNHIYRL